MSVHNAATAHRHLPENLHIRLEREQAQGGAQVWLDIRECCLGPIHLDDGSAGRLVAAVLEAMAVILAAAQAQGASVEERD